MEELNLRKRSRVDSADSEFEFEAKRIKEDLLSLLDDSDPASPERDSVGDSVRNDLDSVIRSFEEEINGSGSRSSPVNLIDLTTSDSGDFTPDLGEFPSLLEEAETRVGDGSELVQVSPDLSGIGEFWDFPAVMPGYDSFGLGIEYGQEHGSSDYVALDRIFDYSDVNLGSDFFRQPDTLPAL